MYPVVECDVRFRVPFGAVICGPTMSGKSEFVFNLIRNKDLMMDKPPSRVVYCYGEWQPAFDKLQADFQVEFCPGLAEILDRPDFFDPSNPTLLIIDDLAQGVADDSRCTKLFTQGIHHKNVSVLLIIQNLYKQGKSMRDIHLNAQYLILYKNCRDIQQIGTLARQTGLSHIPEAYAKVTTVPYNPLLIDMKVDTPDYLRVRSDIQPGQVMKVYVERNKTPMPKPCLKPTSTASTI